jgi:UDP-3-O-[3-hydroxymyristoyl] glucosamine N-acyltransferase
MPRDSSSATGPGIGDGVLFGAHVVVHPHKVIGDGCVIEDGAVLGMSPRLVRGSSAATTVFEPLRIGAFATVVPAPSSTRGSTIGDGAIVGDQAQVRQRTAIGERTVIDHAAGIDNDGGSARA